MTTSLLPRCRHRGARLSSDRWTCTSPKLVVPDGVSAEVCARHCPFVDHEHVSALNLCPQSGRPNLQLVVSRYGENVSWTHNLDAVPVVVYDKGDAQAPGALPNVGREAHTYLHHIVTHYEHLADVTVFVQGEPFDHVPHLYQALSELDEGVGFRDLCDFILVEDQRELHCSLVCRWERSIGSYFVGRAPLISSAMLQPASRFLVPTFAPARCRFTSGRSS
jgi:hypothetical protein